MEILEPQSQDRQEALAEAEALLCAQGLAAATPMLRAIELRQPISPSLATALEHQPMDDK